MGRFQQKYPFLKPSIIRLGGNALLSRIMTEAKAGKHFFDVAHGTGEIVLPLMELGLLAAYASPERKAIPDDLKDKKGFWTSVYVNSVVLGYNKNLTKGHPLPRTYVDLLNPRWKGKKISIDSTYVTFLQGLMSSWGKDKALDYLKKLNDQEPVVMRGSTVRAQLAAAGEFPLVIAYANIIQYLTEKGAPIDWIPLEPAVISVNTVMAGRKPCIRTRQSYSSILRCRRRGRKSSGTSNGSRRAATWSRSPRGCFAATNATWFIPRKCRISMKPPSSTRRS